MKKKRETRGAPKGNKNAAGKRGRKEYYPVHFWGKRWPVDVGQAIKSYLERTGQSQSACISQWVEKDVLKDNDGEIDA